MKEPTVELAIICDPEPINVMDTGITFRHRRVFLETEDCRDTKHFGRWARNLYKDVLGEDQI